MIPATLMSTVPSSTCSNEMTCALCSRLTLSETDAIRKESYKQQQVAHFMVERNPSQTLRLASHNRIMIEHHVPLVDPTKDLHRAPSALMPSQREPGKLEELIKAPAATQDLNKPVRMNFRASGLMSSPRESSHRVQRRE